MAKGLNIDEILASLEQEKTAEEEFAEGVADEDTQDAKPADDPVEDENVKEEEEETKTADAADEDLEKVAAEYDAQGRIMAKAFMDELQKLAVGDGPYTPNMDDAKKGINELVKGEVPEGGKVDAVVAKLRELEGAARSGSYVQVEGQPAPVPPKAVDETFGSTASDGQAKAASANDESPESRIIENLYTTYFEGEDSNE